MAKQPCAVCGKPLGMWSEKTYTEGKEKVLCKTCTQKANSSFRVFNHTFEEYNMHLNQMEESKHIYAALFETLINQKQVEEGSPYNNKHNDERVKRYGGGSQCIWAVDDYGLILFQSSQTVKIGEDGDRNLVFRYSELISYRYESDLSDDDSRIDTLHLTFDSPSLLNEIYTTIYDKNVYNSFDKHFHSIVNGDKTHWDMLADNALARV